MSTLVAPTTLTTGVSRHPGRSVDLQASLRPISFPLNAVLLEMSDGYWLFDTGVSSHMDLLKSRFWSRGYHVVVPFTASPLGSAAEQLDAMGIGRENVTTVVVSHFHADHIGGLLDFPRARIIGSTDGLEEIRTVGGFQSARKALFDILLPEDLDRRFTPVHSLPQVRLAWPGWENIDAWSLSEDESVVAVSLPGHARGQIGLLLNGPGGLFHVADASWTSATILNNSRPSHLTRLVHDDWPDYLTTLKRLHDLSSGTTGLTAPELIPCHCSDHG